MLVIEVPFSGRGGQSALRFARLRMEKRHNYVRKVAETAVQLFVSNDKVNVAGMVLAGSADFKTELSQSDMFDPVSARKTVGVGQLNSWLWANLNTSQTRLYFLVMSFRGYKQRS